ncbi:MAG: hypothetical protein GW833_03180 [Desulfuromonadales bacterium]|nr:hypothetical protein [Desulfuromonadales bacterium]
MQLSCPHCHYSREVAEEKLPVAASRVKCPQCGGSFSLPSRPDISSLPKSATTVERISCPACGKDQRQTDACVYCGLIFARYAAQARATAPVAPQLDAVELRPKAGFWLRLVALMIDGLLVLVLQVICGLLLVTIGSDGFQPNGRVALLIQLFSLLLSLVYWVFFTGYCGQTPGKMLLRLQVVRTDGQPLGYAKAFYRETLGKFVSGIILGIGYLMAAFDDQKQALHDRMANTYVIKL